MRLLRFWLLGFPCLEGLDGDIPTYNKHRSLLNTHFSNGTWIGASLKYQAYTPASFGTSVKDIEDCTWVMVGEPQDIVEDLRQRYEDFGITHYIIDGGDSPDIEDLEYISEKIVKPLSKTKLAT